MDQFPNPDTVIFSKQELESLNKEVLLIQQNFLKQHIELTSKGNYDITNLFRDEKIMVSNQAILYSVMVQKAMEKKKSQ